MPDECTPLINDHHKDNDANANRHQVTFDSTTTTLVDDQHEDKDGLLPEENPNTNNNNNNNNDNIETTPLRRKRSRDREGHHSRDNSALENVLESLHDITDIVVETLEEVQHVVVEGMEEIQEVFEEPIAVPVKPREEGDHSQKLSAVAVAVLVFYKVSGGPFGSEPGVKAAGPFYTLLGYIVFPIIWCIPEALITAELGSTFPEPSGCKFVIVLVFTKIVI